MKKTFLLAALLCSFFPEIGASGIPVTDESTIVQQNRKVEGIIVDEAGEPVIGVNVSVKGTGNGSITDLDGKFTIPNVKEKDVLVVSLHWVSHSVCLCGKTNIFHNYIERGHSSFG